jgi:REP element-mobilizing transposase RayT
VETRLIASLQGEIAEKIWLEIPNQFTFVILDQFVIMPNHIHGILVFNKNDDCKNAINRVSTSPTISPK